MTRSLRVLIIHNLDDLNLARESASDYVFCFERHAPKNIYTYHKITLPFPETLVKSYFDVVIFDSTSLGVVTFRPRFKYDKIKRSLDFLRKSAAIKIFMPQDDYNHSALLDDLFILLSADVVYTPFLNYVNLLYPRSRNRMRFEGALTGYIEDSRIESRLRLAKPLEDRSRLIGQRVTFYPARGGRFSRIKGEVAESVKSKCLAKGLDVDISTDPTHVFLGDEWFAFLGDCKFVLGSESGVSLHDPYGDISDDIERFEQTHQALSFEQIEAACFPGLDGQRIFSALSPRILEAALMGAGQILTEGEYNGVLIPNEDYIPLKIDLSNLDEVIEQTSDLERVKRIAQSAYHRLVDSVDYRFSTFVSRVFALVSDIQAERSEENRLHEAKAPLKEDKRKQMESIRRLLTIDAIRDEAFYEPYLSKLVAERLHGQLGLDVSPVDLKLIINEPDSLVILSHEFMQETKAIIAKEASAILFTLKGYPVDPADNTSPNEMVHSFSQTLFAIISLQQDEFDTASNLLALIAEDKQLMFVLSDLLVAKNSYIPKWRKFWLLIKLYLKIQQRC